MSESLYSLFLFFVSCIKATTSLIANLTKPNFGSYFNDDLCKSTWNKNQFPLRTHNLSIHILNTGPALMNFKPTTMFCGWFWITSLIWSTYWTPV